MVRLFLLGSAQGVGVATAASKIAARCVTPGRPHVWLANVEGGRFGDELAPPRAILRMNGAFAEGGRGDVRARLAASDPRLQHPRQHEPFGREARGS
jgi:hypothetical protein